MAVRRDSSWLQCALFNVWGTDTGSFMYICRLGWKLIFVKYKYQKIFQAIFSSVSGSSFHRFPVCWRVVCTLIKLSGRTFLRIGVSKKKSSQTWKVPKLLDCKTVGFFLKISTEIKDKESYVREVREPWGERKMRTVLQSTKLPSATVCVFWVMLISAM